MSRVAEVERAAEYLPWLVPHFGAIASDLSVYHRIDDPDDIGVIRFMLLLEHLLVYGGAFAASVAKSKPAPSSPQPGSSEPDADTSDAEIQMQWEAVLAREFPDQYGQGVEYVSADEAVRMITDG